MEALRLSIAMFLPAFNCVLDCGVGALGGLIAYNYQKVRRGG